MVATNPIIHLGQRRELFVDRSLIASTTPGLAFELHQPVARNEALVFDQPWEGNKSGHFNTVLKDGDTWRMYYLCWHLDMQKAAESGKLGSSPLRIAIAESTDAVTWRRPSLGLVEFDGSTDNNIVLSGEDDSVNFTHGFTPFIDSNPACAPAERYKAIGAELHATKGALWAAVSPDGLHWQRIPSPVLAAGNKGFDSQNQGFWDAEAGVYRVYFRMNHRPVGKPMCRDIQMVTSPDFRTWSEPVWLDYQGAAPEELYTNAVTPYFRAPHILLGFPTRYVSRPWSPTIDALPEPEHRALRAQVVPRYGAATTDGVFMSSRDGISFQRWPEAFLRPGPQSIGNWTYGDNYISRGLAITPSDRSGAPHELSLFATEGQWRGNSCSLRRFSVRTDGFVSARAPLSGAQLLTKLFSFAGDHLTLNMSTSAAGSVGVGLENQHGEAIPGFSLADCDAVVGDELDRTVTWQGNAQLAAVAGQPVRIRFELRDADLYSYRFGKSA